MKITAPGAWQISPGMAEMGWAASGIPGAFAADRTARRSRWSAMAPST